MPMSGTTGTTETRKQAIDDLRREIGAVLVGQDLLVDRLLAALIAGGHVLIEGVPGLAKTTAVKTLAEAMGVQHQRISFTPDLLPADVIGTMIYNPKDGTFAPRKGPVFTNLLLADEINRAPAKVQSALLEAMQEHAVTIGTETYALPEPFMVMATQNPLEQEGTYPLPEAQIDRFMLKCRIDYPSRDEEREIMARFTRREVPVAHRVLDADGILALRAALDTVYCDEQVAEYMLDIVSATRHPASFGLDAAPHIEVGASPRGSLCLNLAARAIAMLRGRDYTTPQDVKDIAPDVLRHRIIVTYEAEAENITSDAIIARILDTLPVP